MAKIIKPPNAISLDNFLVFLAGSIEMGTAEDWQLKAEHLFFNADLTILNPRRDGWDFSTEQSIDNPIFKQQVNWELSGLEIANVVIFNFVAGTKSPITLYEFGLMSGKKPNKLVVVCPDGFWRKGNIEVVCDRYGIKMVDTLEKACLHVLNKYDKYRLGIDLVVGRK